MCAGCRGDRPFYGGDHKTLRAEWAERIEAGEDVFCMAPACLLPDRWIRPGQAWDLDHDDYGG